MTFVIIMITLWLDGCCRGSGRFAMVFGAAKTFEGLGASFSNRKWLV